MNVPRQVLTREDWTLLAREPVPALHALWADTTQVYALLRDDDGLLLVSTPVVDGGYPALSPARPLAAWFERMVHDLWGHVAEGGTDPRPWLDHGRWALSAPMSVRPGPGGGTSEPPEFLPAGEDLDQIPLGPIRGGIVPAAHFRLSGHGETVVRAEARFGYTHKGTLALMRGKSPRAAARFAATEAALAATIPPRAEGLRGIMAELERIATQLDALASIAEAAGFALPVTQCARQGEAIRRAANVAFGHRLMMDCVVPGGVAADIVPGGAEQIGRMLATLAAEWPGITTLAPFNGTDQRVHDRLTDVTGSIGLARTLLDTLPDGGVSVPLPNDSGEGLGHARGFGGNIWHWLNLDHGQIASGFLCDPGWSQIPALEAALAGGPTDDAAVTLASFAVSASAVDL
jgi:Ni,Fe-hydrogenase III large subunit